MQNSQSDGSGVGLLVLEGMAMEMEGNGCLNFGIVVMGIFRIYLQWGICIRLEMQVKSNDKGGAVFEID